MPSNSLEQEAMDRVRRMYASFDRPAPPQKAVKKPDPAPTERDPAPPQEPAPKQSSDENDRGSLLDLLLKDRDQSLILLLLVMLTKDGADMNLLLALVYILI